MEHLKKYVTRLNKEIYAGNFEFLSCNEYTAKVIVEGKEVEIWIANSQEHCELHSVNIKEEITSQNDLIPKEEKVKLSLMLMEHCNRYKREKLIKQKESELEWLKNSLKDQ